jgi:hypothetical protein
MATWTTFPSFQLAITSEVIVKVVQVHIPAYTAEPTVYESGVGLGTFTYHVPTSGVQSRPPTQKFLKVGILPIGNESFTGKMSSWRGISIYIRNRRAVFYPNPSSERKSDSRTLVYTAPPPKFVTNHVTETLSLVEKVFFCVQSEGLSPLSDNV